jgi:hypothetical protein
MSPPVSAPRRVDDALFVCCGLSWAAGLIHVVAAVEHVDEYLLFGVLFALLAPAQFAWGVLVYRRPDRRLFVGGALASLAVVALWLVSRTVGLPIGPDQPEAVGPADAICSADELVLALLVLVGRPRKPLVALGTVLILTSSLVLVGGGHVH